MKLRVRFCPSPTGNPHVGLIRTCLFNWAYARHHGGTFVFRIEDTDVARDSDESYQQLLDSLRWLGLDWDEGPEVGGPYGPYRQRDRMDIYADIVAQLRKTAHLYESFSTPEEVEARHHQAGRDPKLGYDNFDRELTVRQRETYAAEGRKPVLRLRMPDEDLTWDDMIRGPVTFTAGSVADFVVVRANGHPLYTLVNPVDDARMKITHVLRGEDLLPSTPRQIPLYRALVEIGVADRVPEFGHLPYVMGEGNRKLSKRDAAASLSNYRRDGYLPEALLNYLALLGWSISENRDVFTLREMVAAFELGRVNVSPARFDSAKCKAINAKHIRALPPQEFTRRLCDYLDEREPPLVGGDRDRNASRISAVAPLTQDRVQTLGEAADMLGFVLVSDESFTIDEEIVNTYLGAAATPVLAAAVQAMEAVKDWVASDIEAALRGALVEGLSLKPKKAFTAVRIAITGRPVSPPLFESIELIGRSGTLTRLKSALERSAPA